MEVTNKNFTEVLSQVEEAISDASFLAIDGEFTGVAATDAIHGMDTPPQRYAKLRQGATNYLFIQFGLCGFHYDEQKEKYVVRAFNFYVFPRPFSRQAPDVRFECQTSSIDFLISQGFDFNKLFREGIPYLNSTTEQQLRDKLQEKHQQMELQMSSPAFSSPSGDNLLSKGPIQIPDDNHREFIEDVCSKIEEFLQQTSKKEMPLEICNSYKRKLIYQTVGLRFKSSLHLETKIDEKKQRYIVVSKVQGADDFQLRERTKRKAEVEVLDNAVGFSKVIKMLSDSGKLIVGHNMLLDLLHVINRFKCPLPEEYEDFKSLVKCVFPKIIDTKVMATTPPFRDLIMSSALGDMAKILGCKPFVKPDTESPEGFPGYSTDCEQLHEAGYDAFITGLSFITMSNHLGSYQNPVNKHVPVGSPLLGPFMNKLFLMRVFDIPYINLAGPELEPDRSNVFHITFPKDWKASDLSQLFSPFGFIQITWLDDVSAYVRVKNKDQTDEVLKSLGHNENYRVIPYYMQQRNLASTPLSLPAKRKMPSSDIPVKRKRSSEGASPFPSRHSITPIPEEDESMEEDVATPKSASNKDTNGSNQQTKQDIGVPFKKRMTKTTTEKTGERDRMFEEPETWG